jgi:hypothetical protein
LPCQLTFLPNLLTFLLFNFFVLCTDIPALSTYIPVLFTNIPAMSADIPVLSTDIPLLSADIFRLSKDIPVHFADNLVMAYVHTVHMYISTVSWPACL